MKQLTGPTDWIYNPILYGFSYCINGVDTGTFVSACMVFAKTSEYEPRKYTEFFAALRKRYLEYCNTEVKNDN